MTGPQHYREAERLQVHAQELLAAGVYDAEESLQRAAAVLINLCGRPHRLIYADTATMPMCCSGGDR